MLSHISKKLKKRVLVRQNAVSLDKNMEESNDAASDNSSQNERN